MSSPFPPLTLASSSTRLAVASGSALHIFTPSSDPTPSPLTSSSSDKSAHSAGLVRHIALSPDRIHAATHGDDKALRVFSIDTDSLKLLSTRTTTKRGSHISFEKNDDILVSDKVGDVYSYPLHPPPSDPKAPRPTATELASDPSRNPDATLLLGHVSIVTTHLITPDGKHIITADRDEHIRVSRYPESYVIERYLLGSNGFVSALHIPPSRPSILLSAGGEAIMRVWDWATGEQIESVEIWPQVLPHRKVRSSMRKIKNPKKRLKLDPSGARGSGTFYDAPEGWLLPSGQGVRVKKIESIDMDGQVVVVFFSEGCSALHSFVLPSDLSASPTINTIPFEHPLLDFTMIPSEPGRLLVSLDTAWGMLKSNQTGNESSGGKPRKQELSGEDIARMSHNLAVVEGSGDGRLSDITSSSSSLLSTLLSSLSQPSLLTSAVPLASLNLYPNLSLLPRWPGFEEDEDLAGPEPGSEAGDTASVISQGGARKVYTSEELEKMNGKQLGRLRAQGVDMGDLIGRRKRR